MKKFFALITLTLIILQTKAQLIVIKNTEILVPQTINLGEINLQQPQYIKLIIKNERRNNVIIKNIKAPKGISVSLNKKQIPANSQINMYIGINPEFIQLTNDSIFNFSVQIETNLILPINLNFQAKIKKQIQNE